MTYLKNISHVHFRDIIYRGSTLMLRGTLAPGDMMQLIRANGCLPVFPKDYHLSLTPHNTKQSLIILVLFTDFARDLAELIHQGKITLWFP